MRNYKWETDIEAELIFMFVANFNGQISINKDEVDDGKYWSEKQITNNIGKGVFTPNFELEFDIL